MVKTVIYSTLIAISASFVLAEVPEAFERREVFEDDLLARDDAILEERGYNPTIFSREEDTASLQEREPFFFLAPLLGMAARTAAQVGVRAAARAGTKVAQSAAKNAVKNQVNNQQNNKRKRDLELEDEFDLAAREDMDEFVERELDIIEREMNGEDILERELEEDNFYLD